VDQSSRLDPCDDARCARHATRMVVRDAVGPAGCRGGLAVRQREAWGQSQHRVPSAERWLARRPAHERDTRQWTAPRTSGGATARVPATCGERISISFRPTYKALLWSKGFCFLIRRVSKAGSAHHDIVAKTGDWNA